MKTYDDFFFKQNREKYNLLFYSDEELKKIAVDSLEEIRILCIAELFRRWFITEKNSTAEIIDFFLPDGERRELQRRLKSPYGLLPTREKLTDSLWGAENAFSIKCQAGVRRELIKLCHETDGFIPVYADKKAFFIPFHFEEGPREVRNLFAEKIESWSDFFRNSLGDEFEYTCVIHSASESEELTGSSLLLPLLLAGWRKQGRIVYNHLCLLATGSIEKGVLKAVETSAKAQALQECFPQAGFFFPESTKYCAAASLEIPLAAGMTTEQLLEKLPALIELHGLQTPNLRDAIRRLPQLLKERDETSDRWEELLKRVRFHKQTFSSFSNPREYMLGLMLESSINCHMGRTEEALKFNRKAQNFAKGKQELEKLLRRMEIEELVELQDQEMFDQLFSLAGELRNNIEALEDSDLLMRYYGTMGQAWAYGTLAGISCCTAARARECFEKALENARILGNPGEIAHDLNYLFLWYALFEPESEEAAEMYCETERFIMFSIEGEFNEKVRNGNFDYLRRYKALGLYRNLLMKGALCPGEIEKCLIPGKWWLPATINKYCGALYAACGERSKAEKCFEAAAALESYGHPIIDMIRLTVFAEAFRSLAEEHYREQALELAAVLAEKMPSVSLWQAYLEGKGEFPGLKYWY